MSMPRLWCMDLNDNKGGAYHIHPVQRPEPKEQQADNNSCRKASIAIFQNCQKIPAKSWDTEAFGENWYY